MKEWIEYTGFSNEKTIINQERFEKRMGIAECDKVVLDFKKGTLTFSNENNFRAWSNIQIVGYIEKEEKIWTWSYHDVTIPEKSKDKMEEVKDFGVKQNFVALKNSNWSAEERDGLQMTSIVLTILSGESIYIIEDDSYTYFLVLEDFHLSPPHEKNRLRAKF
tara:strand:- start:22653 stop:23141 length:489 start_codon:yes stop_codon:yes gene_type:complete